MSTRDMWMEFNGSYKQTDSGNKVGHNFRLLAENIDGRSRHHGSVLSLNQQCGPVLILNLLDQKWAEDCIINFDYRYAVQNNELTTVVINEITTKIPTFTDSNERASEVNENYEDDGFIVVKTTINSNTPSSGWVYIGLHDRYWYTSWTDKTYTLSGTLTTDYDEDTPVYTMTHGMVTIPAGTRGYCQVLFNDNNLIHEIKNLVVSSDSNKRYAASGNLVSNTTLEVKTTIAQGTPQTGIVYIGDRSTHSDNDYYEYTSWSETTYQLNDSLSKSYDENTPVYTINNDALQDIKMYCLGDNGMKLLYGFNNEIIREVTEQLQKAFLIAPPKCPLCEGTGEYPDGVECPDCHGYKFNGTDDMDNLNWLYKKKASEVGVYPLDNTADSFQWLAWSKKWWITPTKDRIKEYVSHFLRCPVDKITIDEKYGYEDSSGEFHWREAYWIIRIPLSSSGNSVVGDIIPTNDFTLQTLIYNLTPAGISVVILEYQEYIEGEYDEYCDDYQTEISSYTLNGSHSSGIFTVTVNEAIDNDTPIHGGLTITTSGTDYGYEYTRWSDKTFYLSKALTITHSDSDAVAAGEWHKCVKQINNNCIAPVVIIDNNGYGKFGAKFRDRFYASKHFDVSPYTNFESYTGSGSASGSTITVTSSITSDTRSYGNITIYDGTNMEQHYYSSWSGSAFTLEGTLTNTYSGATVYVGRHELADDPATYTDSNGSGDSYIRVKGVMNSPAPPSAGWIVIGTNRYEYSSYTTGTSPDYTKFTLVGTLSEGHSENENVYIDHFYDDSLSASISHDDYIEKYLLRDLPWIYLED